MTFLIFFNFFFWVVYVHNVSSFISEIVFDGVDTIIYGTMESMD